MMKNLIVAVTAALGLWALTAHVSALQGTGTQTAPATTTSPAPKPEELDRLLAPIALYPDALLSHMLLCATNPAKVGALAEWLASQTHLKGTALQDAAKASGFDESFAGQLVFSTSTTTWQTSF